MGVVAGPDVRQVSGELPPECELAPPQGRLKLHDCCFGTHQPASLGTESGYWESSGDGEKPSWRMAGCISEQRGPACWLTREPAMACSQHWATTADSQRLRVTNCPGEKIQVCGKRDCKRPRTWEKAKSRLLGLSRTKEGMPWPWEQGKSGLLRASKKSMLPFGPPGPGRVALEI